MKSRSIAGVAAAAAAAAAACDGLTGAAGMGLGAAEVTDGRAVDVELNDGGSTEVADVADDWAAAAEGVGAVEAEEAQPVEAEGTESVNVSGANPGNVVCASAADVVAAVVGIEDIPGGGAATASGSSIRSTGKSGSCSSNGEADMPPKPFGTVGVVPVAEAEAVDPEAAGAADGAAVDAAIDNPARAGVPGVLTDAPIAGSVMVVAAVPGAVGAVVLADDMAPVTAGAATRVDDAVGAAVLADEVPVRVGVAGPADDTPVATGAAFP